MNRFLKTYQPISWLSAILLFFCNNGLQAQNISTTEALAPLHKANFDINYAAQLYFLQTENQDVPILDKLEFRTETDEMDFNRQEYTLRSSFNSFGIRKIQKQITSNNVAYYQLRDQELAEEFLETQYDQIIDWHYSKEELDLLNKELILAKDRLVVLKKIVSRSQEVDLVNILKTEKDISEMQRDQFRLANYIEQFEQRILQSLKTEKSGELTSDNWISLSTMSDQIGIQSSETILSTKQQLQANRVEEAELAYDFDNADRKKILDFVQFKYAGRETDLIKKEISFGAGINIPTPASERQRMNERKIDILDEQFEQRLLQYENDQELAQLLVDFENILAELKLVKEQEEQQDLPGTMESYKQSGLALPLSLLRLKESMHEFEVDKLKLEKEACNIYFDILVAQGKISIHSNTNYLSNSLETF